MPVAKKLVLILTRYELAYNTQRDFCAKIKE